MLTQTQLILAFVGAGLLCMAFIYVIIRAVQTGKIKLTDDQFNLIQNGIDVLAGVGKAIAKQPIVDAFIDKAQEIAHLAVTQAEQIYKGAAEPDQIDRKQEAMDFAVNALKHAGFEMNDSEMKILNGLVEAAVFFLPPTQHRSGQITQVPVQAPVTPAQ